MVLHWKYSLIHIEIVQEYLLFSGLFVAKLFCAFPLVFRAIMLKYDKIQFSQVKMGGENCFIIKQC